MVKKIKLSQSKYALVDDEDFKELSKYKWYSRKHRNTYYATRNIQGENKIRRMHRVIMDNPKGYQIDHINHDGLDNRKENLRLVTNRQNHQNRINQGVSKYPGVSWDKQSNKWEARKTIDGKLYWLGRFDTETEAHNAVLKFNKENGLDEP
jgi:hypothetical protein